MTRAGAITEVDQRGAKAAPFNIQRGLVEGVLIINSQIYALMAGTVDFIGPGFKVIVDGESLLRLDCDSRGRLMLSIDLRDGQNKVLALIDRNEWIAGDPMPWDIEFGYNTLTVRQRAGTISLNIDARGAFVSIRGTLQSAGQTFEVAKDAIRFNGVAPGSGLAHLGLVGACLVADTQAGTLSIAPYPRIGRCAIVSEGDRKVRLAKGVVEYKRLVGGAIASRNDPCPCESGLKVKKCCLSPRLA